jgi:hypothetical protein
LKDHTVDISGAGSPRVAEEAEQISLCEALDRILHKGAVVYGEVTVSVANIDLLYLGLQVILASLETARGFRVGPGAAGELDYEPQ